MSIAHESAFARPEADESYGSPGLTRLEYFAAAAQTLKVPDHLSHEDTAKWCFDRAEAMCKEAERRRKV